MCLPTSGYSLMNFWILRTDFTLAVPSTKWVHVVFHASDKIFVSTSVLLTLAAHLKITWGAFFFFFACGILAPWPGIKPVFTALEEYTLNHWTVREIPQEALEMSDAQEQPLKILKEVVWGEDGHWLFLTNCLGNSLVHLGLIITALCKGLRSWWMFWLVDNVSVSCCCVTDNCKNPTIISIIYSCISEGDWAALMIPTWLAECSFRPWV